MSDPLDPPEPGHAAPALPPSDPAEDESYPWDSDLPDEDDADGARQRHDAFTARRKNEFLKALAKTGCIEDACRLTGVGRRTIYRHQGQDQGFLRYCALALRMCEAPVELTAWQRAVEGVEEEFVAGGRVQTRTRYSEGLLRLLLQGSNPRKYGARPGFKRKRLLKHERKQIEREVRAELAARHREMPVEEAKAEILKRIDAMERHAEPGKLAAGWTRSPDGHWIPPGYGPLPEPLARGAAQLGEGDPSDSM